MSVQGHRHWIVQIYRLASLALALMCCTLLPVSARANPTESELRAAVIVAIMRFTTWPQAGPAAPPEIQVCLAGSPNSASHLLRVSGQQKVAGRTLQVKSIAGTLVQDCQVLVLGDDLNRERFITLVHNANHHSILTICDGCDRIRLEDTIIHLTLRKQRVNFEVNLAKAKSNGLALDAQLLELASVVRK